MKSLWTIYGPGQGRYNVFLKRLRTRSYLDFYGSTTFPAFYATLCHGSTRSQTTIYDSFGDIHHFKTRGAVFVLKWHACRAPVNVISLEYPRYHSLWYITIPTALNLNPLSPLCLDLQRLILRSKPVVPGPPGPIISHSVIFLLAVPASNNFPGLITRLRFVPEHVGDRPWERKLTHKRTLQVNLQL